MLIKKRGTHKLRTSAHGVGEGVKEGVGAGWERYVPAGLRALSLHRQRSCFAASHRAVPPSSELGLLGERVKSRLVRLRRRHRSSASAVEGERGQARARCW